MRLQVAHLSMQHSDTVPQIEADAEKLFRRAVDRKYAWVSGTETGSTPYDQTMRNVAARHGYRFVRGGDVWVAVEIARIAEAFVTEWRKVIDGEAGKWPARGVLRVSWFDAELGQVTVLAGHYQTRRTSKNHPEHNQKIAAEIARLAKKHGRGRALVFYDGDQNTVDKAFDTFHGGPMVSCWDELKVWPDTHPSGNIDVISRFKGDTRVRFRDARAFRDAQVRLHTDHYLIEATIDIAPVGQKVTDPVPPKASPVPPKKFLPPAPPVVGGHPNKHSGRGNLDGPVMRIVVHSAVMPTRRGAARQLGEMNRVSTTGSWHYAVDPWEEIQCSFDSYVCWHAPPNPRSIGIEMADMPEPWPSSRTKAVMAKLKLRWRWRSKEHQMMLARTARLTAELALAYDVPLVFLSVAALKAGKRGITVHANVSKAFGQSTHWDVGAWPQRKFMRLVRAHAASLTT